MNMKFLIGIILLFSLLLTGCSKPSKRIVVIHSYEENMKYDLIN